MSRDAGPAEPLLGAYEQTWQRFRGRLEGLDDAEFFWEPVADCWSVRADAEGRWVIEGDGADTASVPVPDPPPVTTIAWRVVHIGLSFVGFGDRLFADGRLGVDDGRLPGSAGAALAFVEDGYRHAWYEPLAALPDERWRQPIGPAFGPYAQHTVTDLALHVLDEMIHHAAEVGLLRDLYPRRAALAGADRAPR